MHERDECVRRRCSHELRPSDHGSVGCACTNQAEIFDLDSLWPHVDQCCGSIASWRPSCEPFDASWSLSSAFMSPPFAG